MNESIWMLPEGIDELLPSQAWALESLRRRILSHYYQCGYDLVHPPQIEYIESLLVGTGREFDLQTFKLVDQLTGRTLGVRADMTPQVARIDAHRLAVDHPVRLCYLGTVLRSRPDGMGSSRSPLQLGAELYGHVGVESDAEILGLMLETLALAGLENIYLDLGHIGLFRALAEDAKLTSGQSQQLFEMLQRKSNADTAQFLSAIPCNEQHRARLLALVELNGGVEVLDKARQTYAGCGDNVNAVLDYLDTLAQLIGARFPETALHFDLAELRGYDYHTGVVFAAYQYGQGQEIARGGRYDDIGKAFGRARPATGFSTDLRALISRVPAEHANDGNAVYAGTPEDDGCWDMIQSLRAQGRRVVCALPGQTGGASELSCSEQLVFEDGCWQVKSL